MWRLDIWPLNSRPVPNSLVTWYGRGMTSVGDHRRGSARASRATWAAFSRSRAKRAWSSSLRGEPNRGATVRRSCS